MTWAEHWSVLLNGSVGSVVGLAGLFLVFQLTRRHELHRDATAREVARLDAARAAKSESVQRLLQAVAQQPRDLALAPLHGHAQALQLLSACMSFVSTNGRDHPAVTAWVLAQYARVSAARRRLWLVAWLPMLSRGRRVAWGEALGELGAALAEWESGHRDDAWFASATGTAAATARS